MPHSNTCMSGCTPHKDSWRSRRSVIWKGRILRKSLGQSFVSGASFDGGFQLIYVIEYFDGEFSAIRSDGDGAVAIRPIDLRMDHFIPPEDIRVGEAEDVFRAATDHGDLRFYLF